MTSWGISRPREKRIDKDYVPKLGDKIEVVYIGEWLGAPWDKFQAERCVEDVKKKIREEGHKPIYVACTPLEQDRVAFLFPKVRYKVTYQFEVTHASPLPVGLIIVVILVVVALWLAQPLLQSIYLLTKDITQLGIGNVPFGTILVLVAFVLVAFWLIAFARG